MDISLDFLSFLADKGYRVINIYDEERDFWFVVEDFRPYNPGQHQHSSDIKGKDVSKIMKDYGVFGSADYSNRIQELDTKIQQLPSVQISFSGQFKYIWFK